MEKAFLKEVSTHQGILIQVCRMYCSDPHDSEDLFQEIMLQLWKSYPQFNGLSKFSTWMYRVALNTAITRLRRDKRRPDNRRISDAEKKVPASYAIRMDVEYDQLLQEAIDTLHKFDRALLLLYLDEKSYREIAEIMGLTETNVGVKINRIKQRLKSMLNP